MKRFCPCHLSRDVLPRAYLSCLIVLGLRNAHPFRILAFSCTFVRCIALHTRLSTTLHFYPALRHTPTKHTSSHLLVLYRGRTDALHTTSCDNDSDTCDQRQRQRSSVRSPPLHASHVVTCCPRPARANSVSPQHDTVRLLLRACRVR